MRHRIAAAVFAALVLAAAAAAQQGSSTFIFPVVMHGPGVAPSFWQSDVFVSNPMNADIKAGFAFFPADQANGPMTVYPTAQVRIIPAHGSLQITDIVYSMFGYSNKKGALLIDTGRDFFPTNPADPWVVATVRNYNTGSDPRGTFGHALPNMLMLLNSSSSSSFASGGRHDASFRCNMGIGNVSPQEVTVHYRIRMQDGTIVGESTKNVPALSIGQWTFASLGIGPQTGPLSAELWLDPYNVTPNPCANPALAYTFFAYLSPVDGATSGAGTGDGEIIPAIPTVYPPPIVACR